MPDVKRPSHFCLFLSAPGNSTVKCSSRGPTTVPESASAFLNSHFYLDHRYRLQFLSGLPWSLICGITSVEACVRAVSTAWALFSDVEDRACMARERIVPEPSPWHTVHGCVMHARQTHFDLPRNWCGALVQCFLLFRDRRW